VAATETYLQFLIADGAWVPWWAYQILFVKRALITLVNKISQFFVPRGKICNPDGTFNTEFKYASSFSPSPTVFFVTAR
jgi:hypothetical protein